MFVTTENIMKRPIYCPIKLKCMWR